MKHRACPSALISERPADRRTRDLGMVMRATAIMRTISKASTGGRPSSGVPRTATSALIGTLSGCGFIFDSSRISEARSSSFSPMPIMPPQQMPMPSARTKFSVSRRS